MRETGSLQAPWHVQQIHSKRAPRGSLHGIRVRGWAEGLQRSDRNAAATRLWNEYGQQPVSRAGRGKSSEGTMSSRRRISDAVFDQLKP